MKRSRNCSTNEVTSVRKVHANSKISCYTFNVLGGIERRHFLCSTNEKCKAIFRKALLNISRQICIIMYIK
jgi:hypothetical protein